MPDITRDKEEALPLTKLSMLKPGGDYAFHFPSVSYERAVTEGAMYQVINTTPEKKGRVTICSLDGKSVLERDDDHQVVAYKVRKIQLGEPVQVK